MLINGWEEDKHGVAKMEREGMMGHILKKIVKRAFNAVDLEKTRMSQTSMNDLDTQPLTEPPENTTQEILEKLEDPFKTALSSLYHDDPQRGLDGQLHAIDAVTRISPAQGMWLYEFCVSAKPYSTLEIGMAYGYSTLYFLAAATKNQRGNHTAIDPFQRSEWHGIGLVHATANAPRWGEENSFRFIEDRSDRVAADLARENRKYDLIFIDGNHRFDDVLVDFYMYSQVCAIGGWIIFDDMWMSSIQTAVSFIRANRADFVELPVKMSNVAVFQKTGEDQRDWREFVEFQVSKTSICE